MFWPFYGLHLFEFACAINTHDAYIYVYIAISSHGSPAIRSRIRILYSVYSTLYMFSLALSVISRANFFFSPTFSTFARYKLMSISGTLRSQVHRSIGPLSEGPSVPSDPRSLGWSRQLPGASLALNVIRNICWWAFFLFYLRKISHFVNVFVELLSSEKKENRKTKLENSSTWCGNAAQHGSELTEVSTCADSYETDTKRILMIVITGINYA